MSESSYQRFLPQRKSKGPVIDAEWLHSPQTGWVFRLLVLTIFFAPRQESLFIHGVMTWPDAACKRLYDSILSSQLYMSYIRWHGTDEYVNK
jgi:hypothetical protein